MFYISYKFVTLVQEVSITLFSRSQSFTVEGDLKLVGGAHGCEGRLQVSVIDQQSATNSLQWSTTCDRDFSTEEIRTACRQLGCPTGNPIRQSISRYMYIQDSELVLANSPKKTSSYMQ